MSDAEKYIVRADSHAEGHRFSHPLNEHSEVYLRALSRRTGLQRLGVSHARVPPGKESFIYHNHSSEEEFVYVLAGRGIAEIDGEDYEVGAGDFMAFPTPSVAHHLRNPFDEDLVYLTGGESHQLEVADFPKLRKRLYRNGDRIDLVDHDNIDGWPDG
jgi:uncharacterized cupin superfamily protein